ncbi:alpha/beta fold hydrolase [Actinoallomurus iriomotensis]|uniref:Alpha/beta hydrolase n=1 Tax=Actinoallomurus iriomotensis TaxID=478107 RepID=A0A9W6RDD7_9ACTN|nr:alpha/beta hydrolase [Actinoallomurus iriomotensis]GLY71997.1 alpha/beta hydrolase [Actinoallomurus iriomotensis]
MTENVSAAAVSADGTVIAFTAWGEGEPLIIIDGATAYPAINPTNEEIGRLLSADFRTYAYDRRGRGESTDTAPYAVEREIEDLAALIEVAGAPVTVFGWSSGAVLALDAAAAGLPIARLALFEPPFVVDDSRPPLPVDYVERLDAAVADGRPGDAAELFLTAAVGLPGEAVGGMRESEFWPVMEAVAPTIAYDGRIMGTTMSGAPLPRDRWAAVTASTLVMHGTGTYPFIVAGARALAELLPTATLLAVEGEQHSAPAGVLAAALRDFAHAR